MRLMLLACVGLAGVRAGLGSGFGAVYRGGVRPCLVPVVNGSLEDRCWGRWRLWGVLEVGPWRARGRAGEQQCQRRQGDGGQVLTLCLAIVEQPQQGAIVGTIVGEEARK